MGNPFVHVELHTQDAAKAKEFYGALFNWTLEDVPEMDYTVIKVGEGTGGHYEEPHAGCAASMGALCAGR